jgi:hypothetical protein
LDVAIFHGPSRPLGLVLRWLVDRVLSARLPDATGLHFCLRLSKTDRRCGCTFSRLFGGPSLNRAAPWPMGPIFWDPSRPGPSRRQGGDPIHLCDFRTAVTGITSKYTSECVATTSYPPTRTPLLLAATVGCAAMLFPIIFCNKQLPEDDGRLGSINRRATLDRRSSLVGCPAAAAVHREQHFPCCAGSFAAVLPSHFGR